MTVDPVNSGPDTRERILAAALAVLAREGYSGATMWAISREAGVSLGLANYQFTSRRGLLAEVIASSRERFLGVLEARPPDAPGPETLRREPSDLDGISAVLLAAFDGIAVRAMLDPGFDSVAAYLALERMVSATVDPAAAPPLATFDRDPYPDVSLDGGASPPAGPPSRPRRTTGC